MVCFLHGGLKETDEGYARTTTGWGYYLVSLQQYLERGKGAPHPDIDLRALPGESSRPSLIIAFAGLVPIFLGSEERPVMKINM